LPFRRVTRVATEIVQLNNGTCQKPGFPLTDNMEKTNTDHTDACDYLRAHVTKEEQDTPSITELQAQQVMQAIAPGHWPDRR
jgi:hypothetical protein